jgi:UDP-N-acetylmuramoyl-tripeptide--D-alanyl-D-alanine ligase
VSGPALDAAFVSDALAEQLIARLGGDRLPAPFRRAVIDSREAGPDDLFVALPGERADGHAFVADAVRAGATGCIVSRPVEVTDTTVFVVDDTLEALQTLGAAWRGTLSSLEVTGITGSVGKTTTKGIIAEVLAARYRVQANPLNYNNEISVPLCLLELQPATQRAVIEMGMYTRGEIALLCEWARPRTGIVLNVGPVHLERAGTIETIALAKRELVEALPANGHAILNADDPRVDAMAAHTQAHVWRFGTGADADVRGSDLTSRGSEGFEFTLRHGENERRVHVPLAGGHLLSNVLAAAAAGLADGLTFEEVASALEALRAPLRIRLVTLPGGARLLDDTYNAQPASMRAALDLLAESEPGPGGRRIALLGDMLELGPVSRSEHEAVGHAAAGVVDLLLTIGDETPVLAAGARDAGLAAVDHLPDRDAAVARLRTEIGPHDVVLVKGSHALGLEHVVAALAASPQEAPR